MTTDTQIIDFAPPRYNLVNVVPGQSFSWRIRFFEEDDTTEIVITGDTFDAEIRDLSGSLIVALTSGSGITATDDHEITLTIDETVTANFDHELTYEYQVNWNRGADIIPCGYGIVELLKPIIT